MPEALASKTQALFAQARECHRTGQLAQAVRLYREVLSIDARHAESLHLLGTLVLERGEADEALGLFNRAIDRDAHVARYHVNRAIALRQLSRHAEARDSLLVAIRLNSRYPQAHNHLGAVLFDLGRIEEAEGEIREALLLKPRYPDALNNMANLYRESGRFDAALECYRKALEFTPLDHPKAAVYHRNLAALFWDREHWAEALESFDRALAIEPEHAETHRYRGMTLQEMRRYEEAELALRRALALDPRNPEICASLAWMLQTVGHFDAAEIFARRAISMAPEQGVGHCALGTVFLEQGRLVEAEACFDRAVCLEPQNSWFHYSLANVKRYVPGDPALRLLESLEATLGRRSAKDQIHARFALAKAREDLDDLEGALDQLEQGNALKRKHLLYDEKAYLAQIKSIERLFSAEYVQRYGQPLAPPTGPIFIVGMLRSGSTLIEQILSCHSGVHAAGEIHALPQSVKAFLGPDGYPVRMTAPPQGSIRDFLRELAARIHAVYAASTPAGRRLTDKLLTNFLYCGLISIVFPDARIIHARRDPFETCMSCYSKLFMGTHPWAYDLAELGRYYGAYRHLMAHWRNVLPEGLILDVDYEDLVRHPREITRRILAHCGLEWQEACLAPQCSQKPVRTASAAQVRRPIYRSAIGRWRPLAPKLSALTEALGDIWDGQLTADTARPGDEPVRTQ